MLALFNNSVNGISVSRLSILEAQSVATGLWTQIVADVAAGVFTVLPLTETHYQVAEDLMSRYGFQERLRTLDALQLAVAIERNDQFPIDGFVLADKVLSAVASAEKIPTILLS